MLIDQFVAQCFQHFAYWWICTLLIINISVLVTSFCNEYLEIQQCSDLNHLQNILKILFPGKLTHYQFFMGLLQRFYESGRCLGSPSWSAVLFLAIHSGPLYPPQLWGCLRPTVPLSCPWNAFEIGLGWPGHLLSCTSVFGRVLAYPHGRGGKQINKTKCCKTNNSHPPKLWAASVLLWSWSPSGLAKGGGGSPRVLSRTVAALEDCVATGGRPACAAASMLAGSLLRPACSPNMSAAPSPFFPPKDTRVKVREKTKKKKK